MIPEEIIGEALAQRYYPAAPGPLPLSWYARGMEYVKRILKGNVLQLAISQSINVGVAAGALAWDAKLVASVNGAVIAWLVVSKVVFEVDLHKMKDQDNG